MLVYVDDIALFGTLDDIQAFKTQIAMHYKVTDLGEVSHLLRRITSRECLHGSTCHTATRNTSSRQHNVVLTVNTV